MECTRVSERKKKKLTKQLLENEKKGNDLVEDSCRKVYFSNKIKRKKSSKKRMKKKNKM